MEALRKRTFYINICLVIFIVFLTIVPAYAAQRFKDNRNGTIQDSVTDLVWIQDTSKIESLKSPVIWVQARDSCRELVHGGYGPGAWRLPSVRELESIVSEKRGSPRIDGIFQSFNAEYWSSTSYSGGGANAWTVNFKDGSLGYHPKLSLLKPSKHYTRCVRSSR